MCSVDLCLERFVFSTNCINIIFQQIEDARLLNLEQAGAGHQKPWFIKTIYNNKACEVMGTRMITPVTNFQPQRARDGDIIDEDFKQLCVEIYQEKQQGYTKLKTVKGK